MSESLRPQAKLSLLLWALAGCGSSAPHCDPGAGGSWRELRADLDRIPLGVYARSAQDVWVSGGGIGEDAGSLVLHYDGKTWRELDAGTRATLWWPWADSEKDVWFVGEAGTTVHWDGQSFTPVPLPDGLGAVVLSGVWGASANDVWAVGGSPRSPSGVQSVIVHWDGARWSQKDSGLGAPATFFKVWGSGPNDVFAVGQLGTIVHWDGAAWTPMESGVRSTLITVHGSSASDVWAVGAPPSTVIHWNGHTWQPVPGEFLSPISGVHVEAGGTVWIVGWGGLKQRWMGDRWIDQGAEPPAFDLHAVWADGRGNALCFGGNFNIPPSAGQTRIGVIGELDSCR